MEQAKFPWQAMQRLPNSGNGLATKAVMLAPIVVDMGEGATASLFKQIEEIKDSQDWLSVLFRDIKTLKGSLAPKVFLEYLLLYLHLVDRIIPQYLDAESCREFQDTMVRFVIKESQKIYQEKFKTAEPYCGLTLDNFEDALIDLYNERQVEYSGYLKIVSEPGEGTAGTVLWEFGKKVATLLGDTNFVLVMGAKSIAVQGLVFLALPDLFQE